MKTNRALMLTGILLVGVLLVSACTQTYSQTPLGTPTLIPTGLFVSPFPSGQDPLQIIAALGTQTAQAGTVEAGGTVAVNGTPGTPTTQQAATTTVAGTPGTVEPTETTASGATLLPVTVIPGGSTFTPTTQAGSTVVIPTVAAGTVGPVPSTYALQKGEFPYCIARRFNVNPYDLLNLNNLTLAQGQIYQPGMVLSLPQNGNPFPAPRYLHSHPDTYTVASGDTIGSVACYYGDVTPQQVASANNLTSSSTLTAGQTLTIP